MYALFDNIQKSKNYELEFQAGIHGVDLKGNNNHTDSNKTENSERVFPFFGDPKEYEHLSDVEKEKMTEKMMGKHKTWARGGVLK